MLQPTNMQEQSFKSKIRLYRRKGKKKKKIYITFYLNLISYGLKQKEGKYRFKKKTKIFRSKERKKRMAINLT